MRLLDTSTLELAEFIADIPPYAILSHTWGDEEVTIRDIRIPDYRETLEGFTKIQSCCARAKLDGLGWVWIDTCCIDKTSSAELTEAINSMYEWYRNASVCYAYLLDVPHLDPFLDEVKFRQARWFTRGWCLQELLAPRQLEFYANDWTELGTKWSLKTIISEITGIPDLVLIGREHPSDCLVAERMSWAAQRKTTRVEDIAYCLMGIFNVNMPLLYGEGRRAFIRLQEEILKREDDYSLFLWQAVHGDGGAFCDSPEHFPKAGISIRTGGKIKYVDLIPASIMENIEKLVTPRSAEHPRTRWELPQMTPRGLRMHLLTKHLEDNLILAWMFCRYTVLESSQAVCISLTRSTLGSRSIWARAQAGCVELVPDTELPDFQLNEVYLPILSESSGPRITLDYLDVLFHLLPAEGHDLQLLEISPHHEFQRTAPSIYKLNLSLLDCPEKLAVSFSAKHNTTEVQFLVAVALFHGPWSCVIFTDLEQMNPEKLAKSYITRLIPSNQRGNMSDRAMTRLATGCYVTVATKTRPGKLVVEVSLVAAGDDERSAARAIRPKQAE